MNFKGNGENSKEDYYKSVSRKNSFWMRSTNMAYWYGIKFSP